MQFDIDKVRSDFYMLNCPGRIYLDSAATAYKPQCMIDAINDYYTTNCSNVHRSAYDLASTATENFIQSRKTVQQFIGAKTQNEIVFTSGTTESINIVAMGFAKKILKPNDEILITEMEHHSNIIPWQMVAKETNAKIVVAPINDRGELILEELDRLLTKKTKIVSFCHASNILGTITPAKRIIEMAHAVGAIAVVDGAQSIVHIPVNVCELDADFYAFSGHKMYGPTGIGVLYGKMELLSMMDPHQGGGGMVDTVSFTTSTFQPPPDKFEAGTPKIAQAIGLRASIDYINSYDSKEVMTHEQNLTTTATALLSHEIPKIKILGQADEKVSLITFHIDGVNPNDISILMGSKNILLRTGSMCAQPLVQKLKIDAATRASFAMYTSLDEVITFVQELKQVLHQLRSL